MPLFVRCQLSVGGWAAINQKTTFGKTRGLIEVYSSISIIANHALAPKHSILFFLELGNLFSASCGLPRNVVGFLGYRPAARLFLMSVVPVLQSCNTALYDNSAQIKRNCPGMIQSQKKGVWQWAGLLWLNLMIRSMRCTASISVDDNAAVAMYLHIIYQKFV